MSQEPTNFNFQESNETIKYIVISKLSTRQLQIIKLAAESYTNKEIANRLFLSDKTIKKTRENSYKALNIKGKEEVRLLLRWAKYNI